MNKQGGTFTSIIKLSEVESQMKIKCKHCGHTMLLGKADKLPCTYCGYYIFKDEKTEFQYRLKEKMKGLKNE